jgi:hypothetical protein
MTAVWVPPGKQRFTDPSTGAALVGGKVYHYIPSTDTPKDTWTDQAKGTLNTNPIILDAEGECTIWGEGLYRQKLFDALGNPIWDQVTGFVDSGGTTVTFATPAEVAALASTDKVISPYALGASGVLVPAASGYGASKPLSDYGTLNLSGTVVGGNDAAFAAAEADASNFHIYTPAGTLLTSLTKEQLTKGYIGDGSIIAGGGDGSFRPPHWSYMTTKPFTWPTQGINGFWRGDQRFSLSGGEWKIIGPNVRTYDVTQRYYESNTMPVASWLDVYSGASGVNAYMTSGAIAGATVIDLNGPASSAWIGKTVALSLTADGVITDQRTVTAVNTAGNNITVNSPIASTYTWNPSLGLTPCIFFGKRSWAGRNYHKIIHAAGGDAYGHNVRMNVNYVPQPSEYHSFMASTGGQYGGDVYFNSDGVYGQFFESQLQGQTYDVTAIGFVSSLVRNVDYALDGGKFWAGMFFQSTGTRPSDVGIDLLGNWRNGLDTVFASMYETSRLTVLAGAGAFTVTVASVNGAHPNDTFIIGSETHTIQSVNSGAKTITLTTALIGSYANSTLVTYPKGGAVVNMSLGQRQVWNSSLTANGRSGDPVGVYPTFYGNVQGDLIMESGNDGSSDYWSVRFARGTTAAAPDTARIRLRPTGVNIFGNSTVNGDLSITGNFNMAATKLLTLAGGCFIYSDGAKIYGVTPSGTTIMAA